MLHSNQIKYYLNVMVFAVTTELHLSIYRGKVKLSFVSLRGTITFFVLCFFFKPEGCTSYVYGKNHQTCTKFNI